MPKPARRKLASVREPIQVYLTREDRQLLDRASETSGISRAEVLRRGLRQYGGAVLSEPHPVIGFLEAMAGDTWPAGMPNDVGRRHDEYLADAYRQGRTSKKAVKR